MSFSIRCLVSDIVPGDLVTTSAHYFLTLGYNDDYRVMNPADVYIVVVVELKKNREWAECTLLTRHGLFLCSSDFLQRAE